MVRRSAGTARGHRSRWLLVLGLVAIVLPLQSAAMAQDELPRLQVDITSVSPSVLTEPEEPNPDADDDADEPDPVIVEIRGTITNLTNTTWTNVHAYLAVPHAPLRSRAEAMQLMTDGDQSIGTVRIVDLEHFQQLGALEGDATIDFRLRIPYDELDIDGTDGVYPFSVHVLATDPDDIRDPNGLARAHTLIPKVDNAHRIDTSIIWPFISTVYRGGDGRYANVRQFIADISEDGRLRDYLDRATERSEATTTFLIDPALLVALRDIAENRNGLPSREDDGGYDEAAQEAAEEFLDDLLAATDDVTVWFLHFGRPDVAVFADQSLDTQGANELLRSTTEGVLEDFDLEGRIVTWPSGGLVTEEIANLLVDDGETPGLLSPQSLPEWLPHRGSFLNVQLGREELPAIIADPAFTPSRTDSVAVVRQLGLAQSAMTVLEQRQSGERTGGVALLINPQWDPVADTGSVYAAFEAPWVRRVGVESQLLTNQSTYDGIVGAGSIGRGLTVSHLTGMVTALDQLAILVQIVDEPDAVYLRQLMAESLRLVWRTHAAAGESFVTELARASAADLRSIEITGPRQVTLSGSSGRVPITLSNTWDADVTVGVRIRAQDTLVELPDIEVVEIGAGQRVTLTVPVSLGDRAGSTLVAEVTTPDGQPLGGATSFNVRTSQFGTIIWVAMGAAALVFVLALTRRLMRRKSQPDE